MLRTWASSIAWIFIDSESTASTNTLSNFSRARFQTREIVSESILSFEMRELCFGDSGLCGLVTCSEVTAENSRKLIYTHKTMHVTAGLAGQNKSNATTVYYHASAFRIPYSGLQQIRICRRFNAKLEREINRSVTPADSLYSMQAPIKCDALPVQREWARRRVQVL